MNKSDLLKLAERVEALSGPDREVAKDMFRAMFPEQVPSPIVEQGYGWREDKSGWWLATGEDARTPPKTIYPPNWLGSLDAAMTLVPGGENGRWNAGKFNVDPNKCSAQVAIEDEIFIERGSLGRGIKVRASGTARTPALALCAAALRALAKEDS